MTQYYSSNDPTTGFDATSTGSQATNFADKVGTWQIGTGALVGSHTHSYSSPAAADGNVALCTGITARADMSLVWSQKINAAWNVGGNGRPSIAGIVRASSDNANHYVILADKGTAPDGKAQWLFFRKSGGGYTLVDQNSTYVGGGTGISFATGDVIWMRLECVGTTIRVRAWKGGTAEPATWDVSWTDSGVTAAGYAGFYFATDTLANGTLTLSASDVIIESPGSAAIAVNTPGTTTAGTSMTVSGTYSGNTPVALDYQIDGGSWVAATSPTISGGNFSFSITAPAAGSHTVSVRDHDNTGVSGTSGSFTTTSSRSIAVTTPSGWVAGATVTLSGTYSGTAPAGLNYKVDAGSYGAASSPTISGGSWSFSLTAPATGAHTITVQESDSTGTTATTSSFNVLASIAPNDAGLVYSPLNWNVSGASAITANAGAYFRTLFTGASCVLNFDASGMVTPASQIWWRIDCGPWTKAAVASTVTLTVPSDTLTDGDVSYHLLEVVVKATTETQNRWNTGNSTRVIFTGLTLAVSAVVLAPQVAGKTILFYGDSITEGVRTLGETASNDTDRNDAMMGWAFACGRLLGAEVGIVGFGASGLSTGGSGNVPALGTSYALHYSGASRSFTSAPDLIVLHEGTNDGSTNITSAMTTVLNALLTACPSAKIAVLRPFNGTTQAANLQAAIAACNAPSQVTYVNTAGFFDTSKGSDGLNLHPSGPNNVALIAPQVAAQLRPLIGGTGTAAPTRGPVSFPVM